MRFKLKPGRLAGLFVVLVMAAGWLLPVREAGEQQGAYTANAGELTRDALVGQTFQASKDNLSGVAVMFATYSGRDNDGAVQFYLRRSITDTADLRTGTVQPGELGDNQFHRFSFEPIADSAGQTYFFFVVSPSGASGRAVTVDLDGRDPYHLGTAYLARGQGANTGEKVLGRSGKPAVDLAFASYYTVPLGVAAGHTAAATVRQLVQSWRENPSVFVIYLKALAVALILIVFLMVAVSRRLAQPKVLLFGLFVLAVGVRLAYATELPLTNDEGNYLYDARTLLEGHLAGGDGYVKAPLVVVWVALWSLLGQSVLIGRLSSVVIGSLTLFPLYVMARELGRPFDSAQGKQAGLACASLWALLGAPTVFSIYVHTQPLAIFLAVSALAVLLVALRRAVPQLLSQTTAGRFDTVKWLLLVGVLLGLGVVSRKSVLALGLVPLTLLLIESVSWRSRLTRLALVGAGFLAVVLILLTSAQAIYGTEGVWEALGANSAEDGINAVDPAEVEQVRAYSIRGMTPFFRESLPLILLAAVGLGVGLETIARGMLRRVSSLSALGQASWPRWLLTRIFWLVPFAVFWWAWSFFVEYEGESAMVFGMRSLWYAMAAALTLVAILPAGTGQKSVSRRGLSTALIGPLWVGGLVIFYVNWIKFHANYIGEFLPPLVLLAGLAVPAVWNRLAALRPAALRLVFGGAFAAVVMWGIFVTSYVTFVHEHTGTFQLAALKEAGRWATDNIPPDEPIFTGAAAVPYLSGHHVSLDIAHPRWYAYEFTRKDTERLNTFLPPAEEMVQAFREANWFLMDQQTAFSFLMEYSEIEAGLERDFESVKGISNGSNTLTFYRRVR